MIEFIDIAPNASVQESEYLRLLGYPIGYPVGDRVRELMEETRNWYKENGKPWIYVRQLDSFKISNDHFFLNGSEFSSVHVLTQMIDAKGDGAVAVAASAGKSCEEQARKLWQEEKPDEYFFMEVYGSAVVEHLIANAAGRICAWAERNAWKVLPRYNPGYSGWDIREQQKFFDVLQQGKKYEFPEEIMVLHSGMLSPKKSQLTLFGLTKHNVDGLSNKHYVPCEYCSLEQCQYRRSPFKHSVQQTEDVRKIQPREKGSVNGERLPERKYSFSTTALEKWSKERLQLQFNDDRTVNATFRYLGTTCSNMGHPLEFDYHITVASPEQQYIIIDAECSPAPGDNGFTYMCEYIERPDKFLHEIKSDQPLMGKSLNDIFDWTREYNPSACYCRPASRIHKWGLVLEVLHYALSQHAMLKK